MTTPGSRLSFALPRIGARALRFVAALLICGLILYLLRSLPLWVLCVLAAAMAYAMARVAMFEGSWVGFARVKLREWATDIRQLWLWARLAFTPGRDQHATAAMAHQHQFLQGRLMSPMNIFTVLPLVVALLAILYGGFQGWRAERAEKQRDAPCSERELRRNRDGEFRTTREACAALGATNDVAQAWRNRAVEIETERDQIIASARREAADELERAQAAERRRRANAERTRRRENEAISAALGGVAPDLERSLCELAGRTDCERTPAADGAAPATADPAGVRDGADSADAAGTADAPR